MKVSHHPVCTNLLFNAPLKLHVSCGDGNHMRPIQYKGTAKTPLPPFEGQGTHHYTLQTIVLCAVHRNLQMQDVRFSRPAYL